MLTPSQIFLLVILLIWVFLRRIFKTKFIIIRMFFAQNQLNIKIICGWGAFQLQYKYFTPYGTCLEYFCRSIFNGWVVRKFVYSKPPGRKMITADINAIIFITGNVTVVINCVSIALRIIFGPLSRSGQYTYQKVISNSRLSTHYWTSLHIDKKLYY